MPAAADRGGGGKLREKAMTDKDDELSTKREMLKLFAQTATLEQLDAALLAGLQKGDEQERRHKAEIPEAFEKLASDGLVTARSLLRRFGVFPYGTENPRDQGAGGWV
jgi:hypothetical protein